MLRGKEDSCDQLGDLGFDIEPKVVLMGSCAAGSLPVTSMKSRRTGCSGGGAAGSATVFSLAGSAGGSTSAMTAWNRDRSHTSGFRSEVRDAALPR